LSKERTSGQFRHCRGIRLRRGYGGTGKDVQTTMIYMHVMQQGGNGVVSPLEDL